LSKLRRQGGALPLVFICALIGTAASAAAQTSALPAGWSHSDIGSPVVAGNATGSGTTFTVIGAGTDVDGKSDEFHFAYRQATGDVDIRVNVASLQNVDPAAKAGIMVRESLSGDAPHAFVFVSPGDGIGFLRRTRAGHMSAETAGPSTEAPVWLRLVGQGNLFSAYSSSNGTTWNLIGSDTVSMSDSGYIGLVVTSHVPSTTATASFTNVTFGSSSNPSLPSPWTAGDVGSPTLPGSATATGGIFTVTGSGEDIWNTSDQFQFAYQQMTGNAEVVARVASLQAADVWTKGGVMIRGALTGPAAHVSMFATGSNGWAFQRRLSAGGTSYTSAASSGAAPGWVRIVREGNLFSAYQSQDGSQWTLVGSDTVSMPATVYVGLAVTSHNTAATATATFSNVAVNTPTTANKPPTISISAPANGASYNAPASIAITATAGDTDGTIANVDFYAGTQLLGSDSSSPFTFTWNTVAAGTYSLTAVATDSAGAKTTSQAIAVTVNVTSASAPAKPTTLTFVPPTDYATNVTSLTLELRRSTDPITAAAVGSKSLGKPTPSNGEISMDISTVVDPLPSGSYYAVVISVGPYGSTKSTPSTSFSK
jgi:regulation of enolase protein 1 (concanavalin A-like superfamily)